MLLLRYASLSTTPRAVADRQAVSRPLPRASFHGRDSSFTGSVQDATSTDLRVITQARPVLGAVMDVSGSCGDLQQGAKVPGVIHWVNEVRTGWEFGVALADTLRVDLMSSGQSFTTPRLRFSCSVRGTIELDGGLVSAPARVVDYSRRGILLETECLIAAGCPFAFRREYLPGSEPTVGSSGPLEAVVRWARVTRGRILLGCELSQRCPETYPLAPVNVRQVMGIINPSPAGLMLPRNFQTRRFGRQKNESPSASH